MTAADETPDTDVELSVAASGLPDVLAELDRDLVALEPVKTRVREIASLLVIEGLRRTAGLTTERPTLHMSFTGNPGTGKTTVAMRMAEILHGLGYVEHPRVTQVTRDDLVGQYVGHTAPKTKAVLKRAMGGVLFIDEAYYLHRPENERDYGQEAIEILLQVMENDRDRLVVILAGYRDRLDQFFASNPGMGSRIAHHVDFPDYTAEQLLAIADLMITARGYAFGDGARRVFEAYVERRMQRPAFANARSIRNALDRARLRQANRLFELGGVLDREQLSAIEPMDILQSRVFDEHDPVFVGEDGDHGNAPRPGSAANGRPTTREGVR